MPAATSAIAALALIALAYLAAGLVFSELVMRSHRQPVARTPADAGMDYEDVAFEAEDGVGLKGWFIPGSSGAVVVMAHPMFFNRHGFDPRRQGIVPMFRTPVDLLKAAKALNGAGHSVLMFDLRNHGESGGGLSGVGQEEWRDVLGAIAYLARRPDTASSPVALLGLCMGANASLAAIARGGAAASRVRCLVAVQPVSALVFVRSYVRDVYSRLGLVLIPLVDRLVRLRGGHPLAEMSPVADAARVRVPCLFLQAVRDPWTEPEDVRAIAGAVAGPSELVMLDEPRRRFDTYDLVGERPEGMLSFLAEHL